MRRKYASRLTTLVVAAALAAPVWAGEGNVLEIDPQAVMEILPLAAEALAIQQRAAEREEQRKQLLAIQEELRRVRETKAAEKEKEAESAGDDSE